jgi:TonB family protein
MWKFLPGSRRARVLAAARIGFEQMPGIATTVENLYSSDSTSCKCDMSAPAMSRLVIRIKLPPREPQAAAPRRSSKGALLVIVGSVVAVALVLVGITLFRSEPTPAPVAADEALVPQVQPPTPVPAPSEAAPKVSEEPPPQPAQSVAPSSPTHEVIPDVPRSALDTIRGTIRITIRVIVDEDGTVVAATADEPGPSRYFARLATEAARKWTFAPTDSAEQRIMLVRFNLTRSGVTGRAIPLPQR